MSQDPNEMSEQELLTVLRSSPGAPYFAAYLEKREAAARAQLERVEDFNLFNRARGAIYELSVIKRRFLQQNPGD